MVNSELATIIRNGIRRLIESTEPIFIKNLICELWGEKVSTDLYFEQIESKQNIEKLYLVQFIHNQTAELSEQIVLSDQDISDFSKQQIEDLEHELNEKKMELQNVIEELETSNEELQSANEELMSSNEELQSSNEELQSVNEELYTVNTEFQEKNKE